MRFTSHNRHGGSSLRTRIGAALAVVAGLLLAGCTGVAQAEPYEFTHAATVPAKQLEIGAKFLAPYGFADADTHEIADTRDIIDALDAMPVNERPAELFASVNGSTLELSHADGVNEEALSLPMPEDEFYVSVAPYVEHTHDCYFHSLTTCLGELGNTDVHVTVTNLETGATLLDENRTTFDNGFVGLWLPRDAVLEIRIEGSLGGGSLEVSTWEEDPTCITSLQLT